MIKKAKEGIRSSYTNEEHALIQAINAYLETSKSYNLSFERLSEWYGIYFPEIKIANPKTLADLAMVLNSKEGIDKEKINSVINDPQKSESIYKKASSTIGRDMNEDEHAALLGFAGMSNQMYDAMLRLESYIKTASTKIMPNTTYLTDEKIAAELLSKAGSMERLATMPASTIQLLGAEKALFKHIKFGSKPPKYGVLFKLAEISNGPRDKRGRIARAYATKISIGLKADFYTKNFIAEKLKSDLEKTIKKIKETPNKGPSTKQKREFNTRKPSARPKWRKK
ncbi:MAG: NOP58 family protein [Candidatus Micrarchaeota archaeon]|nr:NOP58 family protein [Candidatus Micrarchaeota archaeon]